MERAIIAAHGKVLALLATLLERAGVKTAAEFAAILSAFSDMEDDPEQSAIIAQWADTVQETAEILESPAK